MEWLAQNWIWLLVLAAVAFMFMRRGLGGGMGCCGGMAHEGPAEAPKARTGDTPPKEADAQQKEPAPAHRHKGGCC
jgi:hypothetical protein